MESEFQTDIITHSSLFITGEGYSVDENSVLIAEFNADNNFNVDSAIGSVLAGDDIKIFCNDFNLNGDNVFIVAGESATGLPLDGHGDVYLGGDQDEVLIGQAVNFFGNSINFNAFVVDIPSHNALVIPNTNTDCGPHPNGIWFSTPGSNSNPVDLQFCSGGDLHS